MEVASIVASVVSVIVGILAISLAVYFYTQSKNTEVEIKKTLSGIQAQTEALQKIAGRQMDRLTRYVTEPKHGEQTLRDIVTAIKEMPTNVVNQLLAPKAGATTQALTTQLITAYIAVYYYVALANIGMQTFLPAERPEPSDPFKPLVDQSYKDFTIMDEVLNTIDPNLISSNSLHHLYKEATTEWKQYVQNCDQLFPG